MLLGIVPINMEACAEKKMSTLQNHTAAKKIKKMFDFIASLNDLRGSIDKVKISFW